MRLVDFIRGSLDEIIQTWTSFASSIPALRERVISEQEDHARALLLSIANDLERPQSETARLSKSQGRQASEEAGQTGLDRTSGEHGKVRFGQGISAPEVLSEYRALRASVLRLWSATFADKPPSALDELTRFNEAIDQSLQQSMISYVEEQDKKIMHLDQVLSTIPDHACVFSTDARLLYVNRALAEYFRRDPMQLIGMSLVGLGLDSATRFESEIAQVVATGQMMRSEILTELDTGRNVFHEYILAPVVDGQGKVEAVTGTARDITERKRYDATIWRKANFDALTDLPNRHLFRDRLEHEVRHAERTGSSIALLFIDLDRFKQVNDALGHSAGDRLLQQAGQRIRACTRAEDTVARLGGDEFTVILTGFHHTEDVQRIAEKIVVKLEEPFHLNGEAVRISGSVGITLYPRDAVDPENLVRNADQAMYVAKHAGRSRFRFFADDMQQEAVARIRLVADLRHALAEHEFVVHFQPIVRMQTGRIEKAEALVRWNHPRLGMLLPGAFIGTAEDVGLIAAIDNLVLDEAARCCREWSSQPSFQISVNKSPLAFLESAAAGWKIDSPGFISVPPNSLAVEITESVLLQSTPEVLRRIAGLRAAGVQIVLDDFGTGYSAMSYLARFDVDCLKIDQGFVRDLSEKPAHRAIASAIINLAHELGMVVVAEGVENTEQQEWLLGAGCDYAQGFLFSRALPAEEFAGLLHQRAMPH